MEARNARRKGRTEYHSPFEGIVSNLLIIGGDITVSLTHHFVDEIKDVFELP